MVEPNFQLHLPSKKPRLISGLLSYQPNPYSEEEGIYSTRSSVDHTQVSARTKAEFTFRQPENHEKHQLCLECSKLKHQIKSQQKFNINEKSKQADSEKYLKQLKNLLDIKANRLKEEETVLNTEKEIFSSQKAEFLAFSQVKKDEIKEKLKILNDEKKVAATKNKELNSLIFEYKNNKKILKSSIKAKISEKFSLRETIILRSQQELVAKEENLRNRCLEKDKLFKKIEEELMEKKKNINVAEDNIIEKQKILEFKMRELENNEIVNKGEDYRKIVEEKEEEIQILKKKIEEQDVILAGFSKKIEDQGIKIEGFEGFARENLKNEEKFKESVEVSKEKLNEFEKLMKELQRRLGKVSKRENDLDEFEKNLSQLETVLVNEKNEVNNKFHLVKLLEKDLEEKKEANEQQKLMTEESIQKMKEAFLLINEKQALISEQEACLKMVTKKLLQKNLILNYKEQLLSKKILQ